MFFIGKWINILWCIHGMECYSALENEVSGHEKTCRNLDCKFLSKHSQSDPAKCLVSDCLTFCKRRNYKHGKTTSSCQGLGREEFKERAQKCLGVVKLCCPDGLMVDTCHCTVSKTPGCTAPRVSPNASRGH